MLAISSPISGGGGCLAISPHTGNLPFPLQWPSGGGRVPSNFSPPIHVIGGGAVWQFPPLPIRGLSDNLPPSNCTAHQGGGVTVCMPIIIQNYINHT